MNAQEFVTNMTASGSEANLLRSAIKFSKVVECANKSDIKITKRRLKRNPIQKYQSRKSKTRKRLKAKLARKVLKPK